MITFITANNGSLEFFTSPPVGEIMNIGKASTVEETAAMIAAHGIEGGCNLSSSMDFADEFGFDTYHAAKDMLYTALEA
tara:strand:+ start:637 stop:873 length:237 start_codon:yes stop_codon:yes gene_type:complete